MGAQLHDGVTPHARAQLGLETRGVEKAKSLAVSWGMFGKSSHPEPLTDTSSLKLFSSFSKQSVMGMGFIRLPEVEEVKLRPGPFLRSHCVFYTPTRYHGNTTDSDWLICSAEDFDKFLARVPLRKHFVPFVGFPPLGCCSIARFSLKSQWEHATAPCFQLPNYREQNCLVARSG